jgi:hypothetical protein
MKWNLISLMSLAAMMTACSNDETIDVRQEPITFNVTTENVTRATSISTASTLSEFKLYADYTDANSKTSTYLNGGTLKKDGDKWGIEGGEIYWPASGKLSFYAVANNSSGTYTQASKTVTHEVKATVSEQTDLLYAVTADQEKPTTEGTSVTLNFRHALSQIAFQAKNLNSHLKVTISEVTLANVQDKGTLTLPTASTTTSYPNETAGSTDILGTWSSLSGNASYTISGLSKELTGNSDTAIDLSAKTNSDGAAVDDNYMLLIPQSGSDGNGTTAWDKTEITDKTTGTYLGLKCKIENYVANETNLVQLWPAKSSDSSSDDEQAYVYIPVSFDWTAGHKYVYTFIFGASTNGGYDSKGAAVLTPISYTVTVDAFHNKTNDNDNQDINM